MKVSTFPYSALQMRRHRILSVIIGTLKKFDCFTTSKGCTFLNIVKMSYLTISSLIARLSQKSWKIFSDAFLSIGGEAVIFKSEGWGKSLHWRWHLQNVSMLTQSFVLQNMKSFDHFRSALKVFIGIVYWNRVKLGVNMFFDRNAHLGCFSLPNLKQERAQHTYVVPALMVTTNERVSHSEGVRP